MKTDENIPIWGASSEQTVESGETKFPIRLCVKSSTDFLPPGGHRKSVKSGYFGLLLLFTYQKADDQKASTFFKKYYLAHRIKKKL